MSTDATAGATSVPSADWSEFVDFLLHVVPDLDDSKLSPEAQLAELAPDGLTNAILRLAAASWAPLLDDERIRETRTLGEIHQYCADSRSSGVATSEGPKQARVALRPIVDRDLQELYLASLDPSRSFLWRYRGSTTSPDEFARQLHVGVLCQFMAIDHLTGETHGLVSAYKARHDNGTAWLAFMRTGRRVGHGELFEAMYAFIEHLLAHWNLRKLYAELPGYTYHAIAHEGSSLMQLEGCLRDFEYYNGRWWHLYQIAIPSETWRHYSERWRPFLSPARSVLHTGPRPQDPAS